MTPFLTGRMRPSRYFLPYTFLHAEGVRQVLSDPSLRLRPTVGTVVMTVCYWWVVLLSLLGQLWLNWQGYDAPAWPVAYLLAVVLVLRTRELAGGSIQGHRPGGRGAAARRRWQVRRSALRRAVGTQWTVVGRVVQDGAVVLIFANAVREGSYAAAAVLAVTDAVAFICYRHAVRQTLDRLEVLGHRALCVPEEEQDLSVSTHPSVTEGTLRLDRETREEFGVDPDDRLRLRRRGHTRILTVQPLEDTPFRPSDGALVSTRDWEYLGEGEYSGQHRVSVLGVRLEATTGADAAWDAGMTEA